MADHTATENHARYRKAGHPAAPVSPCPSPLSCPPVTHPSPSPLPSSCSSFPYVINALSWNICTVRELTFNASRRALETASAPPSRLCNSPSRTFGLGKMTVPFCRLRWKCTRCPVRPARLVLGRNSQVLHSLRHRALSCSQMSHGPPRSHEVNVGAGRNGGNPDGRHASSNAV